MSETTPAIPTWKERVEKALAVLTAEDQPLTPCTYCPYCQSSEIGQRDQEIDDDTVTISYECRECDGQWSIGFDLGVVFLDGDGSDECIGMDAMINCAHRVTEPDPKAQITEAVNAWMVAHPLDSADIVAHTLVELQRLLEHSAEAHADAGDLEGDAASRSEARIVQCAGSLLENPDPNGDDIAELKRACRAHPCRGDHWKDYPLD